MFTQGSMSPSNARSYRCKFKKMSVLKCLLEMYLEKKLMKISEISQFLALVYSKIYQTKKLYPSLTWSTVMASRKNAFFSARTATLIEHTVRVRSNIISAGVEYLNTRLTSKNLGMLMATAKATQGREYNWNLKYIHQI
jgi:hypothetical protein